LFADTVALFVTDLAVTSAAVTVRLPVHCSTALLARALKGNDAGVLMAEPAGVMLQARALVTRLSWTSTFVRVMSLPGQ
jgi:hypothetical protein